jgi:hypothetical protein
MQQPDINTSSQQRRGANDQYTVYIIAVPTARFTTPILVLSSGGERRK